MSVGVEKHRKKRDSVKAYKCRRNSMSITEEIISALPLITASTAVIALLLTIAGLLIAWKSHKEKIVADMWKEFEKNIYAVR